MKPRIISSVVILAASVLFAAWAIAAPVRTQLLAQFGPGQCPSGSIRLCFKNGACRPNCESCAKVQEKDCLPINDLKPESLAKATCEYNIGCVWAQAVKKNDSVGGVCVVDWGASCKSYYDGFTGADGCCPSGFTKHLDPWTRAYRCWSGAYWLGYASKRYCPNLCGNGRINPPEEECDDGNRVNGDGCSSQCKLEKPVDCRLCGNNIVNDGEQCDDGNKNNLDKCTNDCRRAACGDGITQASNNEQCDDGNKVNGDGCSAWCRFEKQGDVCGNGVVEPPEQCDDGNKVKGDGCFQCRNEKRSELWKNGVIEPPPFWKERLRTILPNSDLQAD